MIRERSRSRNGHRSTPKSTSNLLMRDRTVRWFPEVRPTRATLHPDSLVISQDHSSVTKCYRFREMRIDLVFWWWCRPLGNNSANRSQSHRGIIAGSSSLLCSSLGTPLVPNPSLDNLVKFHECVRMILAMSHRPVRMPMAEAISFGMAVEAEQAPRHDGQFTRVRNMTEGRYR